MSSRGTIAIVLALTAIATGGPAGDEFTPLPYYAGRSVCLSCHERSAADAHGCVPCRLEEIPRHDATLALLGRSTAESIAALSGVVGPPRKSRICLDCHATAADDGPRWMQDTFRIEDGIQCENCHGPGSLHVSFHQATADWARAVPRSAQLRRGSREDCVRCHVDRPSHTEVLQAGFRLLPADKQYKTPVNLVVSPDGERLYVACEHSNSLIVVRARTDSIEKEVAVGLRPHGVAVSPDGRRVYVTNRLAGTVSVLVSSTLEVIGEVAVGLEPHGLWVDPTGRRLFVANTGNNSMSIIDTEQLTETRRLVMGNGPWGMAVDTERTFAYITNVRPNGARFREPQDSEVCKVDIRSGRVVARLAASDANMLQGVAWVHGADVGLVTLMRTKNLIPISRLRQGWVITNGLGVIDKTGRINQVLLDEPNHCFPDPMDVAATPDGTFALVTSGASDEVALIDVRKLLDVIATSSPQEREEILPNHLGSSAKFVVRRIPVGANPRGVAFAPDGRFAYVANALDDTVSVIDTTDYRVARTITLGGPLEETQIRWGEKLFHRAEITYAQQFSCHSCHPDGHINGLTFDIEADGVGLHPVDNRTLRGIFDTPPFKWEGTNPSIHRQCGARLAVFFTRLDPYNARQLSALVRYLCTIELAPNPYREPEGLTVAQRRGKAVFERTELEGGTLIPPDERCVTCHRGALFTDRRAVSVGTAMWFDEFVGVEPSDIFNTDEYGELGAYYFVDPSLPQRKLDVPHLRNIFNSPPYLHNGASATLEEIWTRFNLIDLHGATANLTRPQLNDLIAYLKSL